MWEFNGKQTQRPGELGKTDDTFTFLGRDVNFKGVISFEGTVRIDGRLDGEIHTKGTLIVGEHAVITGIVTAGTVVSSGRIKGTITATDKVQLLKPAVFVGEIHTPAILVEEGAHFQGISDMGASKWDEVEPRKDQAENVHDITAHRHKVRALTEMDSPN